MLFDLFVTVDTHAMQCDQVRWDPFFPGGTVVALVTQGLATMAVNAGLFDCSCARLESMVTLHTGNFKVLGML